jgi:hypothetical protein
MLILVLFKCGIVVDTVLGHDIHQSLIITAVLNVPKILLALFIVRYKNNISLFESTRAFHRYKNLTKHNSLVELVF